MTTKANEPSTADDLSLQLGIEQGLGPAQPIKHLLESARRLSAMIPEKERKASRARMVAYLEEVAAREPSQQPDDRSG